MINVCQQIEVTSGVMSTEAQGTHSADQTVVLTAAGFAPLYALANRAERFRAGPSDSPWCAPSPPGASATDLVPYIVTRIGSAVMIAGGGGVARVGRSAGLGPCGVCGLPVPGRPTQRPVYT
jgi:hypothetical protein